MLWIEFASKLGLALVLGSAIGIERQWRQRSAGLRTNALVSLGAVAFVLLSRSLTASGGDPSRIASQIVAGIGFLGAGVIMREGLTVQGLNTAATIWCSAAVGSLAGAGLSDGSGDYDGRGCTYPFSVAPGGIPSQQVAFNDHASELSLHGASEDGGRKPCPGAPDAAARQAMTACCSILWTAPTTAIRRSRSLRLKSLRTRVATMSSRKSPACSQ